MCFAHTQCDSAHLPFVPFARIPCRPRIWIWTLSAVQFSAFDLIPFHPSSAHHSFSICFDWVLLGFFLLFGNNLFQLASIILVHISFKDVFFHAPFCHNPIHYLRIHLGMVFLLYDAMCSQALSAHIPYVGNHISTINCARAERLLVKQKPKHASCCTHSGECVRWTL